MLALRLRLRPARLSRCWCHRDGSCCGGKSPIASGLQLGSRAVLPGLASVASTLRLRLCPAHLSHCCCWCRCSGRSFPGCVCAGAWVAFTSARLRFSSRPVRGSMSLGLGMRGCLSLSLPFARARACVGVGVAPMSTCLQLGSGLARESMPVGLGTRACLSLSLSSTCTRAFLPGLPSAILALRLRLCSAR